MSPCSSTGMPRSESKKAKLLAILDVEQRDIVDKTVWDTLKLRLAPISDGYLRRLLRDSGTGLTADVDGVRQDSFDLLARSLVALAESYDSASASERERLRALVVEAKDRARWSARRAESEPDKYSERREMLMWIMTWLENPALFPVWLRSRLRVMPGG